MAEVRSAQLVERTGVPTLAGPTDVARALMQVAHEKNVGAIVIGHSRYGRLHELVRGSIVQNLLRLAGDVDVHVVADRDKRAH